MRRLVSVEVALEKADVLRRLVEDGVIVVEDEDRYLGEAFRVALETGITVYDSLYIAQARRHHAVLVTYDAGQARAAQRLGVLVELVA